VCSVHRYTMSELRANCLDAVSGQGQGGGCGACVRAHRYTMSEPRRRHVRPWREDEAEMGELTIVCDILKRPTWQGAAVHSFPFRCSTLYLKAATCPSNGKWCGQAKGVVTQACLEHCGGVMCYKKL